MEIILKDPVLADGTINYDAMMYKAVYVNDEKTKKISEKFDLTEK